MKATKKAMNDIDTFFQDYFKEGTDAFLPHISINCIIFGYDHPKLKVLTLNFPGDDYLSLPGGYVKKEESLEEAAYRNLKLIGIENVFLQQTKTFGEVDRIKGFANKGVLNYLKDKEIGKWISQRFISVTYYGLIDFSETKLIKSENANRIIWLDTKNIQKMVFDHTSIIENTVKSMTSELLNLPIASKLLPESFTLNELRGLFEVILNRDIDRGTFRRKMLHLGIIEQIDKRKDSMGRPAHLFRFNQEIYQRFLTEETKFGF